MLSRIFEKFEPEPGVEKLLLLLLLAIFLAHGRSPCFTCRLRAMRPLSGNRPLLDPESKVDLMDTLLQPPLPYYLHGIPS